MSKQKSVTDSYFAQHGGSYFPNGPAAAFITLKSVIGDLYVVVLRGPGTAAIECMARHRQDMPATRMKAIEKFASALLDYVDVDVDGDFSLEINRGTFEIDSGLVVSRGALRIDAIDYPMQIDELVGTVAGLLVDAVVCIDQISAGASAAEVLAAYEATDLA